MCTILIPRQFGNTLKRFNSTAAIVSFFQNVSEFTGKSQFCSQKVFDPQNRPDAELEKKTKRMVETGKFHSRSKLKVINPPTDMTDNFHHVCDHGLFIFLLKEFKA